MAANAFPYNGYELVTALLRLVISNYKIHGKSYAASAGASKHFKRGTEMIFVGIDIYDEQCRRSKLYTLVGGVVH